MNAGEQVVQNLKSVNNSILQQDTQLKIQQKQIHNRLNYHAQEVSLIRKYTRLDFTHECNSVISTTKYPATAVISRQKS